MASLLLPPSPSGTATEWRHSCSWSRSQLRSIRISPQDRIRIRTRRVSASYGFNGSMQRAPLPDPLMMRKPLCIVQASVREVRETAGLGTSNELKKCLRCGTRYNPEDNKPDSCKYHGHMTGDRGLYAIAPPHQGIDGEWSDVSGIIVYKWNDPQARPNTGSKNWKKRWTCCGVYGEDAPPCHSSRHVSYDDGATMFT